MAAKSPANQSRQTVGPLPLRVRAMHRNLAFSLGVGWANGGAFDPRPTSQPSRSPKSFARIVWYDEPHRPVKLAAEWGLYREFALPDYSHQDRHSAAGSRASVSRRTDSSLATVAMVPSFADRDRTIGSGATGERSATTRVTARSRTASRSRSVGSAMSVRCDPGPRNRPQPVGSGLAWNL